MSDPVTNVEIEDVLSSIRRLVSADDRPQKDEPEAAIEAPDRLVLTPALRVDESHDSPAEEAAPEADDMAAADEAAGAAPQEHDQGDAPDTAQDTAHDDAWDQVQEAPQEPATDHADPFVEDAEIVEEAEFAETSDHDEVAQDRSDDEDYDTSDDDGHDHPDDAPSDELKAYAAGFEEAVAAREDQWEPDGDSSDDYAAQPVTAMPWQDHVPDPIPGDDASPENPAVADANEGLDPFVAEPDDGDDTEEAVEAASAQEAPAAAVPPPGNAFAAADEGLIPDDILDEDALRDLVAEIVRQELQGSLGERITRNVRKLVRREIQRALAAQELE